MKTTVVHSFKDLKRILGARLSKLDKRLERATRRAAQRTARTMASNVRRQLPVAFGRLRNSIHAEGSKVIADAPHAAAVEWGAKPHWVPIKALIEWVRLRGMQSTLSPSQLKRLPGNTTTDHATRIGSAIEAHRESSGYGAYGASPVDAVVRIAYAIQAKIAKVGTKPHGYMAAAVPQAKEFLEEEVGRALTEHAQSGSGD